MDRNMDRIIGEITKGNGLTQDQLTDLMSDLGQMAQTYMIALAVLLVVGLLLCFLGLKLIKLWGGLAGLLVGAAIGLTASLLIGLTGITNLFVVLFAGLLMLALSIIFRRLGMFWVCLFAGGSIGTLVIYIDPVIGLIAVLIVGLLAAILGAVVRDPVVIILTSIQGGIISGTMLMGLLGGSNYMIGIISGVVLMISGMIVQFMLKSREIGKHESVLAEKVKEEKSRETEVEAARNILSDEDED